MEMSALDIHDSILFLNKHGNTYSSKDIERNEQLMAYKYINENDTVLELGTQSGTNSCLISRLCKKLVTLDPDKDSIEVCKKNMNNHGVEFECLWGIISRNPQKLNKDDLFTYSSNESDIPYYSIDEIEKLFLINFNTIVADCEGCIETVIKENDISKIKKIMYELDRKESCNYEYVSKYLIENGFINKEEREGYTFWEK
jgi:tRNA A58 N-methylase Trm61